MTDLSELSPATIESSTLLDSSGRAAPEGLTLVAGFLSPDQEAWLLGWVDGREWSTELSRRVQHYGFRYDYRSRGIDASASLGPIPPWAATLGGRMHAAGLLPALPNQVIVNEYVGSQGIGAHIDSLAAFPGPVATVSLGEAWQMVFRSPAREIFAPILPRGSAAILAGPAREAWTHEIPKRANEAAGPRGRRVSLTFRAVAERP